jgi:SAM-dependent methyltransferase
VTRPSGAVRIFLYNWPIYAGTWAAGLIALALAAWRPALRLPAAGLGAAAITWSVVSLLVSFYVYDRSPLVGGRWLPALLPSPAAIWAAVHAGLDAEIDLDAAMPGRCLARLDVFDPAVMRSGSIGRARARTPPVHASAACSPMALSLPEGGCDAVVVAFTAHEIRDAAGRERFMDELRRALRPGGRVVLVEHLRDAMNFLAFGPGFVHFLPRREWLRLARHAQLAVAVETRVTPWVRAFALERAA